MDITVLQQKATQVSNLYDELNLKRNGKTWSAQDVMAGFVGDVGDLSEIVMAKNGLRHIDDVDAALAHELSDCLWSILVLADKYNVDISAEFTKTMDILTDKITHKINNT